MQGMEEMLSLELKKEMADRYFGFRSRIEQESRLFDEQMSEALSQLEQDVGFDLIRLYMLLSSEQLIRAFFQLTLFHDALFLDTYIIQSSSLRNRLFKGQLVHGFTRYLRFTHLFFDIYRRLQKGLEDYAGLFDQLVKQRGAMTAAIQHFEQNNDLPSMMGFLRRIDSESHTVMEGDLMPLRDSSLDAKLRMPLPAEVTTLLPAYPLLPPLKTCKGKLTDLLKQAYARQHQPEVRRFCHP